MYTSPRRIISSWANDQSGAPSDPPDTLNHSIITVPLNSFGSVGRTTTTRVLYAAEVAGWTAHLPSEPSVPT